MRFIISWNAGFGPTNEIIECDDFSVAIKEAYEGWKEEVEGNADYNAIEYSKEKAVELGLEEE